MALSVSDRIPGTRDITLPRADFWKATYIWGFFGTPECRFEYYCEVEPTTWKYDVGRVCIDHHPAHHFVRRQVSLSHDKRYIVWERHCPISPTDVSSSVKSLFETIVSPRISALIDDPEARLLYDGRHEVLCIITTSCFKHVCAKLDCMVCRQYTAGNAVPRGQYVGTRNTSMLNAVFYNTIESTKIQTLTRLCEAWIEKESQRTGRNDVFRFLAQLKSSLVGQFNSLGKTNSPKDLNRRLSWLAVPIAAQWFALNFLETTVMAFRASLPTTTEFHQPCLWMSTGRSSWVEEDLLPEDFERRWRRRMGELEVLCIRRAAQTQVLWVRCHDHDVLRTILEGEGRKAPIAHLRNAIRAWACALLEVHSGAIDSGNSSESDDNSEVDGYIQLLYALRDHAYRVPEAENVFRYATPQPMIRLTMAFFAVLSMDRMATRHERGILQRDYLVDSCGRAFFASGFGSYDYDLDVECVERCVRQNLESLRRRRAKKVTRKTAGISQDTAIADVSKALETMRAV